jgi:gliding motility-associated lipoprotein GldK
MKKLIFFAIVTLLLSVSCGRTLSGDGGELVGVSAPAWNEPNPYGMVLVGRGSFAMGPADKDSLWGTFQDPKGVSIDAFWMDETEITNAEYRQFVYWVRDSILRERLSAIDEDYKITEDKDGEPLDPPVLNWKKAIPSEKRAANDEDMLAVLHSVNWTNPITGVTQLDAKQMIYRYQVFDYTGYALRRNRLDPAERVRNTDIVIDPNEVIMISKDTAYFNEEGKIISETVTRPLSSIYDFLNNYIINIYPDETVWVNDFNNANNESYTRLYFNHPGYNDYPVVGVSYEQAQAFCVWRTEQLKKSISSSFANTIEPYRLPTEAEWEYAARAGKSENRFPWSQDAVTADKGCFLGNFKPGDGDYTQDGHLISAKVATFSPNGFGLYDMAGNISEWTSTAYLESGPEIMSDMNPEYRYNAAKEDPYAMKKKVVRGGSWKDPQHFIRSDVRSYEYQNEQHSYIGFRCVRTQVGFARGKKK